jgi:hypothetical protein
VSPSWSEPIAIGIGADRVEWLRPRSGANGVELIDSAGEGDFARSAAAACARIVATHRPKGFVVKRPVVDLMLGLDVAHSIDVPWPSTRLSAQEREALARACFSTVYDQVNESWAVRVDFPHYGRPGLAHAAPRALLTALQAALKQAGARLRSVRCLFEAAQRDFEKKTRRADALVGVGFDGRSALVGVRRDGAWMQLRPLPAATTIDEVEVECRQAAILAGVSPDAARRVFPAEAGSGSAVGMQAVLRALAAQRRAEHGFARPPVRLSTVVGATVSVAACVAIGWMLVEARRLGERIEEIKASAERQAARNARAAAAAAARANVAQATPAQIEAARAAAKMLAIPWRELFAALEAADSADVALLALDPDPAAGLVAVRLEARNVAALLAYAERLARQPGVRNPLVTQYQTIPQDTQKAVRARMTFEWNKEGR